MSETNIPISKIRTDGGTQPRAALDKRVIEDYREAMEGGAVFPPIDAFYDGTNYWLADGFHRVGAATAAGRDEFAATVHQGSQEDAQWHSFSANQTNGLRRTNADKLRAVNAALEHPNGASQSNCQIADHVGVTETTVRRHRDKLSSTLSKIAHRTVTRAGSTYQQNTANIGRANRRAQHLIQSTPSPQPTEPVSATISASGPTPESGEETTSSLPECGSPASRRRAARTEKINNLVRSRRALTESMRHFLDLVNWLGETAGQFDEAQLLMSSTVSALTTASAELKQRAIAHDPMNQTRFLT